MGSHLEDWPKWAEESLQGIAFWMGHRRCLYRDYPLGEAAIVAEVCNLVFANLKPPYKLRCEVNYTELLGKADETKVLTKKARADLVVGIVQPNKKREFLPSFVIEVKRGSAPNATISTDLSRLASFKRQQPGVRAFLFVVSEATRPKRFVNEKGSSILGRHNIEGHSCHYRVRRTWKAAHAYNSRDHAQYASLIEVFVDSR